MKTALKEGGVWPESLFQIIVKKWKEGGGIEEKETQKYLISNMENYSITSKIYFLLLYMGLVSSYCYPKCQIVW